MQVQNQHKLFRMRWLVEEPLVVALCSILKAPVWWFSLHLDLLVAHLVEVFCLRWLRSEPTSPASLLTVNQKPWVSTTVGEWCPGRHAVSSQQVTGTGHTGVWLQFCGQLRFVSLRSLFVYVCAAREKFIGVEEYVPAGAILSSDLVSKSKRLVEPAGTMTGCMMEPTLENRLFH